MYPRQTQFRRINTSENAYNHASNYLAQGIGSNHIALGQAQHELLYTAEQEENLIGVARLLINPTPQKIQSYDFDQKILQNHTIGILAGAYVDPQLRSNNFRLEGRSLARHLSNIRIQDAWNGTYNTQSKPLDILITRCRQTSSPMYENNNEFRQVGGWVDKQRGALTYHISKNPNSNIDLDSLINNYYTGPQTLIKKAV